MARMISPEAVVELRREIALQRFNAPGFSDIIALARARIALSLAASEKRYVAFSAGKDSTAVMALALSVQDDITIMWSDDELEMPESLDTIEVLRKLAGDQLVIVQQSVSVHAGWFVPWTDRPYWRDPFPGSRRSHALDAAGYMAGQGYDLTILGTRAEESRKRRDWLVGQHAGNGTVAYTVSDGTQRCNPIWDWTVEDVWALIIGWRIPYNAAYDRMHALGVEVRRQRVGPLPLVPRDTLAGVWPDMYDRLVARYGQRW